MFSFSEFLKNEAPLPPPSSTTPPPSSGGGGLGGLPPMPPMPMGGGGLGGLGGLPMPGGGGAPTDPSQQAIEPKTIKVADVWEMISKASKDMDKFPELNLKYFKDKEKTNKQKGLKI